MRKATLQEFLTPKRTLALEHKNQKKTTAYQLGRYDLSFHNMIYYEFATEKEPDGSKNFINRLTHNDPNATYKGIYYLIEDKTDFPTFKDFTDALSKYKLPLHKMQLLLTTVMQDSIPNHNKKKLALTLLKIAMATIFAGILYMI